MRAPGLAWMCQQEESDVKGGILADEMGMGKTIQAEPDFMGSFAITRDPPTKSVPVGTRYTVVYLRLSEICSN